MSHIFPHIGIIGKPGNIEVRGTLVTLIEFLQDHQHQISVDEACRSLVPENTQSKIGYLSKSRLAEQSDLIIVIGGDGSFLDAARTVVDWGKPMVGINRGRLGFLTDISPQAFKQQLLPILHGEYRLEHRFLLNLTLRPDDTKPDTSAALNDVVLYSGDIARMIEFEMYVNQNFVYRLRSDGLILSTPTGSTAYALSGGGPILNPALEAIVMVPMHPHTLSSRPIVLDASDEIELHLTSDHTLHPKISCDGQVSFSVKTGDRMRITRKNHTLKLLHPLDYDYYHTLRTKLNWSS